MAWKILMGLGAALVISGSSALAFQEQNAGSVPQAAPSQEQAAPAAPATGGVEFATPVPKDEGGTEVRIPGLGTLGVLPKMDFGLELLYGANDGKTDAAPTDPQETAPVDLMIRGTVKHNF
jgi:hypothetical protein